MSEQEAITIVKRNFGYPIDMPYHLWHAAYGSYSRPAPDIDSLDVWEVTATGEELGDYFIPTENGSPRVSRRLTVYIDDKLRGIFLTRISDV